jgi:hypothetical protein
MNQPPKADDTFTPDVFNGTYLNMEVALLRGSDKQNVQFAKVTTRLQERDGKPIGISYDNPLLDTRENKVEFLDGQSES